MIKEKPFASSTDKANKPKIGRNHKKIPCHPCQCSSSSQIPIQNDLNYHQFLSLYRVRTRELIIYDTENEKEEIKALDNQIYLDESTCVTQLPNGELFCYGNHYYGTTVIIDRSYRVRMLPSGTPCFSSSVLYFENNIYCFGGYPKYNRPIAFALSRKFDLIKSRWMDLALLPNRDGDCHSVIFNGNILVSGYHCKNLWLYSVEIDSFSIIPYDFALFARKILINIERLYLIEHYYGIEELIYESEDEYHWKSISKWEAIYDSIFIVYCLYNQEKVYISTGDNYYQFDLKEKIMRKLNTF